WKTEGAPARGASSTGFARWHGGTEPSAHLGPIGARASVRVAGAAASTAAMRGVDASGEARTTLSLPLARGFGGGPDPVAHRIEPEIDLAAMAVRSDGVL